MGKDVAYYLAQGFERKAAEYFAAGRRKPVFVKPNAYFTLSLHFDNGERRIFDMKPLLEESTVFAPFRCQEAFSRVYLDSQGCVCWDIDPLVNSEAVWSNKVDLSPDTCYLDSVPES